MKKIKFMISLYHCKLPFTKLFMLITPELISHQQRLDNS